MGSINAKELQKFHDLWAPVLQVLPTVINAVEKSDDLERHNAALQAQLADKIARADAQVAEAEARLSRLNEQLKAAGEEKAKADAEAKVYAVEAKRMLNGAKKAFEVEVENLGKRVERARAEAEHTLIALGQEVKARQAEAALAYADAAAAKEKELAELDAKLETARKALDKLRAKLV